MRLLLAGCGYIVTPEDEASAPPALQGSWTAVATKVEASAGALHVDITITNATGAWSAMQATGGQPAVLTTSDGKTTTCATVFVGTGGTYLAPGFAVRGLHRGARRPLRSPSSCTSSARERRRPPVRSSRIAYGFVTGEFNYYSPPTPTSAKLEVDLDKVAADLKCPVAPR